MSGADDAREPDFKETSARLNAGLKTCRAVVDNYRAMIIGEHVHPAAANDDETETGDSENPLG